MDKREKAFIELEMSRYEQYKEDIATERELILESSPGPADGMPKGYELSNPTADKAGKLLDSVAILAMEKSIRAVDKTLNCLSLTHKRIFTQYYVNGRRDYYAICDELHISYETFRRYKKTMILMVGKELGVLKR